MPSVLHLSRSVAHGFSKQPQPFVRLIAGEGVEDDAHRGTQAQHLYHQKKMPGAANLSQVHLLASEKLQHLTDLGFAIAPGELGENILTAGIDLIHLPAGTTLALGDQAVVQITGLRTPCLQIDRFKAGLQQHLWGPPDRSGSKTRQAGVMSIVLRGGIVHSGDRISVELPAEPHHALLPVEVVMRQQHA